MKGAAPAAKGRRARRNTRVLACVALWAGAATIGGCGRGCAAEDGGSTTGAAEADAPAPDVEPKTPAPPGTPSTGAGQLRYDFARHVHRAELRHGEVEVLDFGAPGGAKHFLGGWQTSVGDDVRVDGVRAVAVPGASARWIVWATDAAPAVLTLRGRAGADGRVAVHVNEVPTADGELPTDRFGTLRVAVPEGALAPGANVLQLRVPRTGAIPGAGRAGLVVDWMRLGSADDVAPPGPPDPARLAEADGDVPRLRIPRGWALAYAFEVPPDARLRAGVRSGDLRVDLERDGHPETRLASVPAGEALDVDLGARAGEVVRVVLRAEGGEVVLRRPGVVTFPADEVRPPPPAARNVLVYLVDTLRADKLRPYDPDTRVETPGFSRHARAAAVFERGTAPENWTKPSVATLLTSLMPWEHTATTGEAVLPASVRTLPQMLRDEGFFTGAFIANGFVSRKFGFHRGWHTFRNYIREGRRTPAEFVAADVLAWLDRRPQDRPFFLYVHTIDPHVPYIPPDDVLKRYDPEPYAGPIDFTRDRELLEKIKVGALRPSERDRRRLEALYDGEITYHDTHFAAILDGLERRGLAEDTVVVVTSDHGEELFDHGSVGHGHTMYQELLHVPLTVRVPGLTDGGGRIGEAVGLVDVVPTVLDALGLPHPEGLQGRSLLPLLRRAREAAPRPAVASFLNGWRALVVGRYKLVHRTHAHLKLYDLAADPKERQDLAEQRPITARYLQGLLGLALRGEAGAASRHRARATDIDPETEAQLRALGYVGTSRR
ncbi:MAG: sulfatase [Myxococcota bacterium]